MTEWLLDLFKVALFFFNVFLFSGFLVLTKAASAHESLLRVLTRRDGSDGEEDDNTGDDQPDVLLVIAHPDDEAMFFSPLLRYLCLREDRLRVNVLCISNGNFEGLGKVREKELTASCCDVYGVRLDAVHIWDDEALQDGIGVWDPAKVASAIAQHIQAESLGQDGRLSIFTFDQGGVSGHRDHIACFHGTREYVRQRAADAATNNSATALQAFALRSVPLWRKYAGMLDAFYSVLSGGRRLVCCDGDALLRPWCASSALLAMREHKSQWVWFRRLYVIASRYVLVNDFERVR